MYSDRVDTAPRNSIKDRLNVRTLDNSGRRRLTGKRQRQDGDKWEHDLYEQADLQVSNRRVGALDLRLKLQKKSNQRATIGANGSLSGGVRDLREKLSGISYSQPAKTKPVPESSKPRRSVVAEAPVAETKKAATTASERKKAESVESFLHALGLEKYLIQFQAEEVDMMALQHITDEDLKAIGIPMGPRKKILLAMESKA